MTVKPTSKTTYALRALVDLALHQGIGPVNLKTIAKRQEIPLRYLEQLFNRLRREGLVASERGPRGGYSLSRPADQITVSQVFACLQEGPRSKPKNGRLKPGSDPTISLWKQVESVVQSTLESTTLRNLADQVQDTDESLRHRYTFHI